MVVQYPHTATVVIATGNGIDSKGYQLPPTESEVMITCRAEPNTTNALIYLGDGSAYQFKYILYLKVGQQETPVGSVIKQILDTGTGEILFTDSSNPLDVEGEGLLVAGEGITRPLNIAIVKMYIHGQLNARIWL